MMTVYYVFLKQPHSTQNPQASRLLANARRKTTFFQCCCVVAMLYTLHQDFNPTEGLIDHRRNHGGRQA